MHSSWRLENTNNREMIFESNTNFCITSQFHKETYNDSPQARPSALKRDEAEFKSHLQLLVVHSTEVELLTVRFNLSDT